MFTISKGLLSYAATLWNKCDEAVDEPPGILWSEKDSLVSLAHARKSKSLVFFNNSNGFNLHSYIHGHEPKQGALFYCFLRGHNKGPWIFICLLFASTSVRLIFVYAPTPGLTKSWFFFESLTKCTGSCGNLTDSNMLRTSKCCCKFGEWQQFQSGLGAWSKCFKF